MKTIRTFLLFAAIVIFTAFSVIISGCKKDKTEKQLLLLLPPQSGFVMNFIDFSNPGDTLKNRSTASCHNWGYSYLNVLEWNPVITDGMAVPVASFLEASNHEQVYNPDAGNWTWSYNFKSEGIPYAAIFTAKYIRPQIADSMLWEMRISKGTEYTGFLWYYGKTNANQTSGYWIINENPTNPNNLFRIDWIKQFDGSGYNCYTIIKPGAVENGSYFCYATQMLSDPDRFYIIYNKGLDNITRIEWNSLQKNGHVKDPHHYLDENWHCWDSNLMDDVCP
jgi:hypothetical protein